MDPFAAVPIFLSLTRNYTQQEKNKIVLIATVTVLIEIMANGLKQLFPVLAR